MIKALLSAAITVSTLGSLTAAEPAPNKLFELRIYKAAGGKLDPLLARFRDYTVKLFEKHGMTNVGYWVPVENSSNHLIYIRSFADFETFESTTASFRKDEEWQQAAKESQNDGKLLNEIESKLMEPLDFSKSFVEVPVSGVGRVFEMRTYIATPGNLEALHSRFRDHTLDLFEKHGMVNLGYFKLNPGQDGSDDTLIYFLAHKDKESAEKSWQDFSDDPEWIAAKKASEENAGGSLTAKDGVKSIFLEATDFSPVK